MLHYIYVCGGGGLYRLHVHILSIMCIIPISSDIYLWMELGSYCCDSVGLSALPAQALSKDVIQSLAESAATVWLEMNICLVYMHTLNEISPDH